jgi:hypothetical protein
VSLAERSRSVLRVVRAALTALVILSLLMFVTVFVWPTPYRYDHMTYQGETVIVRLDRFSDDAEMLLPDQGWVPLAEPDDAGSGDQQARL